MVASAPRGAGFGHLRATKLNPCRKPIITNLPFLQKWVKWAPHLDDCFYHKSHEVNRNSHKEGVVY
jgi:hypothetical protein